MTDFMALRPKLYSYKVQDGTKERAMQRNQEMRR